MLAPLNPATRVKFHNASCTTGGQGHDGTAPGETGDKIPREEAIHGAFLSGCLPQIVGSLPVQFDINTASRVQLIRSYIRDPYVEDGRRACYFGTF